MTHFADLFQRLHKEDRPGWRTLKQFLLTDPKGPNLPRISTDDSVQAFYLAMRYDGTPHRLAEMFALQLPPMSNTDREFLEGHCNGNQFDGDEFTGNYYAGVAKQQGVSISGKVYIAGLAAYPGDPEAWVSGKGDVERVLDKRGWGADGAVKRKVAKVAEPMGVGVAPELVQDRVIAHLEDEGATVSGREFNDLVEKTAQAMKPHWAD